MRKLRIGMCFVLGLGMGLTLSVTGAHAGPRPTSELALFQLLNGEITRDMNTSSAGAFNQADGGGLTLWTNDAGPGCNNVATGAVYEMHCSAAGHFCPWGSDGGAGLAFCGNVIGNVAYGKPINASTPTAPAPFYFVTKTDLDNATKSVCVVPAVGTLGMTCVPYRLK